MKKLIQWVKIGLWELCKFASVCVAFWSVPGGIQHFYYPSALRLEYELCRELKPGTDCITVDSILKSKGFRTASSPVQYHFDEDLERLMAEQALRRDGPNWRYKSGGSQAVAMVFPVGGFIFENRMRVSCSFDEQDRLIECKFRYVADAL